MDSDTSFWETHDFAHISLACVINGAELMCWQTKWWRETEDSISMWPERWECVWEYRELALPHANIAARHIFPPPQERPQLTFSYWENNSIYYSTCLTIITDVYSSDERVS